MNTKSIVFILLYSAALFNFNIPLAALAESNGDSELNISGKVVAPSCTIAPDTVNGNVDLGEVLSERLQSAGSFSAWSQFSLNLTECPATTTEVVVYLLRGQDPDYPVYFKNTGSSKHVAIEVADDTGSRISNGSVRNMAVDSQQQAKMVLKGRMISPQGKAISGSVSSLMELAFGYK